MADYASLKVPELKKLLAERKLPQTGNKPDLIARLQDEDNKSTAADAETKPAAVQNDVEARAEKDATTAAADAPAAPATSQDTAAAAAAAAASDTPADAPKDATTESGKEAAETDVAAGTTAPAPSFAIGLSSSIADEEAKKRAERAKRFGAEEGGDDEDKDNAKKRAERARRFGLDKDVSGLDSALPERSLKRGRGHHHHQQQQQDGYRAGKRQFMDRGGDRRQGRGPTSRGSGVLDDPAEKAKAEKRAARFAAV